jgi:hypothetical protein
MDGEDSGKNFFKYVFNFDDNSKYDMMNIAQYTFIALIPVVGLNKAIQKFVPEADEEKSSLELLAEVLIQVIVMFFGLLFIHRIVTFVPTYSGVRYPDFSIIFIVLAVLMITLSLQTKLGEKVSILTERLYELWDGTSSDKKKKKNGKNGVKVSQPISGQQSSPVYNDSTSISMLPSGGQMQQSPNFDSMVRADTTPLVNAAVPGGGIEGFGEPMAANAVLGGAFGGSAW